MNWSVFNKTRFQTNYFKRFSSVCTFLYIVFKSNTFVSANLWPGTNGHKRSEQREYTYKLQIVVFHSNTQWAFSKRIEPAAPSHRSTFSVTRRTCIENWKFRSHVASHNVTYATSRPAGLRLHAVCTCHSSGSNGSQVSVHCRSQCGF